MKKLYFLKSHTLLVSFLSILFILAIINAQTTVSRDSTTKFLTDYSGTPKVAEVPPAIDFGVIDIGEASPDLDFTHWGNVVLGPDNKFYYAIGVHNENGTVTREYILSKYQTVSRTR